MKLATIFCDHAVLQQKKNIPVWGTATPLARIAGRLGNTEAVTVAGDDGRFRLYFPAQTPVGPLILEVQDLTSHEKVTLTDVYIGEVWLAAGQSNMELTLAGTGELGAATIAAADRPLVRFYVVPVTAYPSGRSEAGGTWTVSTPAAAGAFSAVAYHFAEQRQRDTGMAVGIIQAACGGTNIEAWLSRGALLRLNDYEAEVEQYDPAGCAPELFARYPDNRALFDRGQREVDFWKRRFLPLPENVGAERGWQRPDYDDSAWERMELPDSWTMAGYNHAGVFWFRLSIDLPSDWAGKDLELDLGAVDKGDITFFNGEFVGATGDGLEMQCWQEFRHYSVPGKLVKPGRNLLAVRAASAVSICADGGLIGPASKMWLRRRDKQGAAIPLAGVWKLKMEHDLGIDGAEKMRLLGAGECHSLHMMFDNLIAPVIPYAVRGAVWYQGEANAICGAGRYRSLLGGLIRDWRRQWAQREYDFLTVQLPGFQEPRLYSELSTWAQLREAQELATIDCGTPPPITTIDGGDIFDLHPKDKRPVGARLARAAAGQSTGPRAKTAVRHGHSLRVTFVTGGSALQVRGDRLDGFVIAGNDGVYQPAEARIRDSETVELTSASVPAPERVCYAWTNNPSMANLTDADGLPAAPFRLEAARA